MENPQEFISEIFNKEIIKLRRELYESYKLNLIQYYCPEDVERSWIYFGAFPIINSLNRKSLDVLIECCEVAKQYRGNNY